MRYYVWLLGLVVIVAATSRDARSVALVCGGVLVGWALR